MRNNVSASRLAEGIHCAWSSGSIYEYRSKVKERGGGQFRVAYSQGNQLPILAHSQGSKDQRLLGRKPMVGAMSPIFLAYLSILPYFYVNHVEGSKHNRFIAPNKPRKLEKSDTCKGLLPWTCVCTPEVIEGTNGPSPNRVHTLTCLHSRLTHSEILSTALQTFQNVQSATFYGNNFPDIPERFSGINQHKMLLYLNLTGNHIQRLHYDSLLGVPSLQSLDLSENSIHLRHEQGDWSFLRPVRYLRRLLLRHAFKRHVENENGQLHLLEQGLRHAHLRDLQFLDLTNNGFTQFPHKLICWLPMLTHLILAHNRFRTLRFEERCTIDKLKLKVLDLRGNRFVHFSFPFAKTAAHLPHMSVQISGNPLDCSSKSCASWHSMIWFRATAVIRDKELVRCHSKEDGENEGLQFDNYMLYAPLDNDMPWTTTCTTFEMTSQNTVPPIKGYVKAVLTKAVDEDENGIVEDEDALKNMTIHANSTASAILVFYGRDSLQLLLYYWLISVIPALVNWVQF